MPRDSIQEIRFVAERLGALVDRVVFVGGATVGLLVTEPGAAPPRPTRDVDVVVEVTSTIEYLDGLRSELTRLGFRQVIDEGVICRWAVEETIVDIMPAQEAILGFSSTWYPATLALSQRLQLLDGPSIRLISAACFLATKLEAFAARGRGDYSGSHDMEDICSVVDGRPTIVDEVEASPAGIRSYIAAELARYLADDTFLESLAGQLQGDSANQGRRASLIARLERMAHGLRRD
jgi:hypothetical protein